MRLCHVSEWDVDISLCKAKVRRGSNDSPCGMTLADVSMLCRSWQSESVEIFMGLTGPRRITRLKIIWFVEEPMKANTRSTNVMPQNA